MKTNKKKLVLYHEDKGLLLKIPCEENHNHPFCWVFELDVPAEERFDKEPVIFKSKKECLHYAEFLLSVDFRTFNDKLSFEELRVQ